MKDFIELPNNQRMPIVGLGMWQADDPLEIDAAVEKALDCGFRHFDTATLYQNEEGLGRSLKKYLDAGKVKREDLFIVTKLPWTGMRPERVSKFMDLSLKKLQLDYVDLYLMHWPFGLQYTTDDDVVPMKDGQVLIDPTTKFEDVWRAMELLVDAGKARAIGISNFNPSQMDRLMKIARIRPANHQFEVHLYFQNKEWIAASHKHQITCCAYGPLGSPGRLTYNYKGMDYHVPPLFEDEHVVEIARRHGKTPAQVLLRFLTQLGIAVIPKSTNADRLKQNIQILEFELTASEMKTLEGLDKGEAGRSFPVLPGFKEHPECPF